MALMLSKSRIEALSDGVFSIAMTLLVLKLEVPDAMHQHSDADMLAQLRGLLGGAAFFTYVITFLIAGGFWFLHHLTFHFIRHVNGFLVGINLVFLMMVSLLPFSAELMGHLFVHPVSQLFYFGNQFALAVLLNLHWQYATHLDLIIDADRREAKHLSFRVRMTAIVFLASIIVGIVEPFYSWVPIPIGAVIGLSVEAVRRRGR
jgi:uncharacterized membrane protein